MSLAINVVMELLELVQPEGRATSPTSGAMPLR